MTWDITANQLTVGGVLLIAVLLVFLGQLIPRWVVSQIKANYEAQLARAEHQVANLEAALNAAQRAREVQARQLDDLLELGTATDAFIRSLQHAQRRELP